eukprot:269506_1
MSSTELSEHATKLILPDFSDPGDPKFEPGSQNALSVKSHSQHSSSNLIHPCYSQSSWQSSVANTIDLISSESESESDAPVTSTCTKGECISLLSDSESESDTAPIAFTTQIKAEIEWIDLTSHVIDPIDPIDLRSDSDSDSSEGDPTTTIKEERKAQHKRKEINHKMQQYMKDMTEEDKSELMSLVKSMQMEPDAVHSTQSITFAHRLIMILVYILQTIDMDKGDTPQVLVISPRRHASSKIATCLQHCLENTKMISLITGGVPTINTNVSIISATPGKLLHQVSQTPPRVNLKGIKTIIIESCDTMKRSNNLRSQMDEIAKHLPKRKIKCLEFNATWEEEEEEKEDVSKIHYSNWESDIRYVRD